MGRKIYYQLVKILYLENVILPIMSSKKVIQCELSMNWLQGTQ